ncbi:MAG: heavy metal-binding domain-containing protein [Verrucomicrobiae bacterium]
MKSLLAKLFFAVLFAAIGAGAVLLFQKNSPPPAASAAAAPMKMERKVLFYQSPMHPWVKSDKPGKCTVCGMDLVPVYESADGTNTAFGLKLNPDSVTVLNVQTTEVERRPIRHTLRVAGCVVATSWTAEWFEFTAYERDFTCLKADQIIEVSIPSLPGKTFQAKINLHSTRAAADTDFDATTGSTTIRAEFSNGAVEMPGFGGKKLFSGLYAEGRVLVETPEVLAVPRSAILSPGAQPLVYVDGANGHYEPRKITLGLTGDDYAEVLAGLQAGEQVVTHGNLLIDAEAQISQIANGNSAP